ncbi:hypothetical protein [Achromobacter dolens]|uniref:hypothetical protein n=1 Tax=Achromobacter dolens TaxID=1287738 RepID=UPI0015815363|nr:hypothetical protein [Achromobacter dolens]
MDSPGAAAVGASRVRGATIMPPIIEFRPTAQTKNFLKADVAPARRATTRAQRKNPQNLRSAGFLPAWHARLEIWRRWCHYNNNYKSLLNNDKNSKANIHTLKSTRIHYGFRRVRLVASKRSMTRSISPTTSPRLL